MASRALMEQLDQAVQGLLLRPKSSLSSVDANLRPLLQVAAGLRGLPRRDFKARLKAELQGKTKVSIAAEPTPTFKRAGFHTITPYIVVREAQQVIEFVRQTFGAEGAILGIGSAGGIHAEYKIGDSMVMIGGGAEAKMTAAPAALHVYVNDVDAVYERAVQAGGITIHAPEDRFYGDRDASVEDVAGNHWYIATNLTTGGAPQGMRSVTPCLLPKGAPEVMEFLKRALGAEELSRHASPQGIIRHATMRIGDSMIEMGEAHGPYQPMPSMFYLYVESADESYQRAIEAGAKSISAPGDQPYGDRVGGVADPFGNQWFLATHLGHEKK